MNIQFELYTKHRFRVLVEHTVIEGERGIHTYRPIWENLFFGLGEPKKNLLLQATITLITDQVARDY